MALARAVERVGAGGEREGREGAVRTRKRGVDRAQLKAKCGRVWYLYTFDRFDRFRALIFREIGREIRERPHRMQTNHKVVMIVLSSGCAGNYYA